MWINILLYTSRAFSLSTPNFSLSIHVENSEAIWKKATKYNKSSIINRFLFDENPGQISRRVCVVVRYWTKLQFLPLPIALKVNLYQRPSLFHRLTKNMQWYFCVIYRWKCLRSTNSRIPKSGSIKYTVYLSQTFDL